MSLVQNWIRRIIAAHLANRHALVRNTVENKRQANLRRHDHVTLALSMDLWRALIVIGAAHFGL
jgi:hypothetical protein